MLIRYLAAVALMAGACAAHADVIPSSTTASAASTFLSGWTTGNGTDVMSSGVISGNLNLIGGVAYGSAASADALFTKASGSLGTAADSAKLYYTKGVEGMYLLGAGHGLLAAMLGNGVSVVSSNGGVVVSDGTAAAQQGGGGGSTVSTGGGSTGSTGGGTTGSTGGGSTGKTGGGTTGSTGGGTTGSTGGGATGSTGGGATGSTGGGATGTTGGGATGSTGGGTTGGTGGVFLPPEGNIAPPQVQLDLPTDVGPTATVPEPSTIALMLAGLLGAGSLSRRRNR
jgi:hypothetical protein